MSEKRPAFELVTYDPADAPAEAPRDSRLFRGGVPRDLLGVVFRAAPALAAIGAADGRRLIRFGGAGPAHDVCVDPATGRVVESSRVAPTAVTLINTDLDAFTASVRAMTERFPYYGRSEGPEEPADVGAELAGILADIDENALTRDGFWEAFVDDVKNGDFPTEDVLSAISGGRP